MRIRTKITATYVILAGLIVASLGTFASLWIESYLKNRLVGDLSRQADLVQFVLQEDSTQTFAQVDKKVKYVSGLEHLRITLIDRSGNVLAESDVPLLEIGEMKNHLDRPEVRQAMQAGVGHDVRLSTTLNHAFLYMAKKVRTSPQNGLFHAVEYIRLSVPYEEVQHQIDNIRFIEIVTGFGVLVAVVAVSIMVSHRITSPMTHIARDVERIQQGDLDARFTVKSNDEIALIAGTMNELVDKLKADIVQMKKLEHVRSQFLGNVSHELRTPIFSAQGYLETLLGGALNDPSVNRAFVEKAQSNLRRLHILLEDLINISQIESGEMKMSFRIFPVNNFLESVGKEYEAIAAKRNISFRLLLNTKAEDEILGDRERLRQVLNNLLNNAIDYNRPGGEVVLSSEKLNDGIEISVVDTGVGIPPEHLSRIFERFYRVDNDRSRELGGTGLGLAIVKHIIEAHGSRVVVESNVGEGSVFRFVLKSS